MSSPSTQQGRPEVESAWYVYGIVEADVEVLPEARGVGEPPASVELVRSGDVAALVSEIKRDQPLGRPDDLLAHQGLLDAAAADAAVLPMRFGAVVGSRDAVVQELLTAHHDQLVDALRAVAGHVQYVVRSRYVEDTLMREVLDESPTAAQLAGQLHGQPSEATRDLQLQLGEIVNDAVEAKRSADTESIIRALEPVSAATAIRAPTHEQDAAHVALLVQTSRKGELDDTVNRLARDWEGRATLRVLGPMAPFDFIVTTEQGPGG
jgi:hypothetical protein